jgi:hypothetical protein
MAISSAVCTSFKVELLKGVHNFSASGGDTFRIALYTSSASLGAGTTAYSTSNEISNTSGSAYVAKGAALTSVDPAASGTTAVCDFNDVSYTSASFTANGALIFNDSASGDPACAVIAFGGDKTVSSGTFTIQFPAADASNAIIRLA